ncbi:AbrB/MazE/SpoVT family DNA-binding domain-containing protein [Deinococcus sp. VB343]|uniref:AbrB/MazE/SpoVT family DNA-binding domain-containing protein n=1 Tax=Deinococcus sp. VB142 TaxID=3112952 RepID=A0AAU6Q747_9DEIO
MSITAKITSKGQVTLPKEVRELLGVGTGDSVRFEVRNGTVEVYPQKPIPDFAAMIGAYPLGPEWDGLSAIEVVEELRGDPEERAALHAGPPHPNVTRLGQLEEKAEFT